MAWPQFKGPTVGAEPAIKGGLNGQIPVLKGKASSVFDCEGRQKLFEERIC